MIQHLKNTISLFALAALCSSTLALANKYETEPITYLDQNWSAKVRQKFYTTAQGSQLIPLHFALALQSAKSQSPFFSSDNLTQYGFIAQKPDPRLNPYGFAVGLTIDGYTAVRPGSKFSPVNVGQRYVGMNCAACHTNNLRYGGKTIRIDGGQSLLNFQAFIDDMDQALFATAADQTKLESFLNRAQMASPRRQNSKKLTSDFRKFINERMDWRAINSADMRYGHGRTDAFGVIFNQVLARALRNPANAHTPDAPVSYPVLWDTPQHDFVQWNGLVSNSAENSGPLARNIGQVLGVFGQVDVFHPTQILNGYCSSARRKGLLDLEKWTKQLVSPKWPAEIFHAIDIEKSARGQVLYNQRCLSCHAVLADTRSPARTVKALLIPSHLLGVDGKLGVNSGRMAAAGVLQGRMTKLLTGRKLDALEPSTVLLSHVVAGAVAGSISAASCHDKIDADPKMLAEAWSGVIDRIKNPPAPDPLDGLNANVRNALIRQGVARLKARPLNGIWASPPFLHNGSVATIYDLLRPAAERAKQFTLGCSDYDPINLGYNCTAAAGRSPTSLSTIDATIEGSLNTGHEYTSDLSDSDRYDLLEYLKSL